MELIYQNDLTLKDNPEMLDCIVDCLNAAEESTDEAMARTGTSVRTDGKWTKEDVLKKENAYLILCNNGEPVGSTQIAIIDNIVHIKSFAILPQYRGKGYGEKLMGETLAYAKKRGCTEARLMCAFNNIAATSLYSSCGFSPFTVAMFKTI